MKKLRQVVLDTETTGLDPKDGHRIIEIGCIELIDRRVTPNNYHVYINPEREIEAGAMKVHGITNQFLQDKPMFADIVDDFIAYIDGAELIIHNAPFDIGFINHEFRLLNRKLGNIDAACSVIDTLQMARKMHPGQRNSLDALCKRYGIDNSGRNLHGALIDSDLLALTYLAMTSGQDSLFQEVKTDTEENEETEMADQASLVTEVAGLKVLKASPTEIETHDEYLEGMRKAGAEVSPW